MKKYFYKYILILICVILLNTEAFCLDSNKNIKLFIGDNYKKSTNIIWKSYGGKEGDVFTLDSKLKYNNNETNKFNDIIVHFLNGKEYTFNSCISEGFKNDKTLSKIFLNLNCERNLTRNEGLEIIKKQAQILGIDTNKKFISQLDNITQEVNEERFISIDYDDYTVVRFNVIFSYDIRYNGDEPIDGNAKRWFVTMNISYFKQGLPPKWE